MDDKQVATATLTELKEEAGSLADELCKLLNGHTNIAISAAIFTLVENNSDIRNMIAELFFKKAAEAAPKPGPCQCPGCVLARTPKAKA